MSGDFEPVLDPRNAGVCVEDFIPL